MRPRRRDLLLGAGLFTSYVITAKLGLSFDALGGVATPVWPPTGISLAALVLYGFRLWPAITLGALVVNLQTGTPVGAVVGIALGNTLEAVVGAWLLRRAKVSPALDRIRETVVLIVLGALLSTMISATFGATSVWASGAGGSFRELWWVWWVGDVGGGLVVAPFLLSWLSPAPRGGPRASILEAILVTVSLAGCGLLAFGEAERAYLVFPPLLWAALRFGPRGAAGATLLLSVVAIVQTAILDLGIGRKGLVELQLFVAVLSATALVLGATVAERRRAVLLRDEFLSVASHELRTPLAALKLKIEGLERRLRRTGNDETSVARAAATSGQIARLERLIDELLDVSRITSGRLHLEHSDVHAASLVEAVVSQLPGAPTVELDLDRSVTGRWDALRIEQVLTNLLRNAHEHGSAPICVSLRRTGTMAVLDVSDAGQGIPAADRLRVFERFEQGGRGRTGGLGLGLYITRQIVEAHGGSIRVERPPSGGTSFVVELPAAARDGVPSPR
jgi:signal transduction histidine kinase